MSNNHIKKSLLAIAGSVLRDGPQATLELLSALAEDLGHPSIASAIDDLWMPLSDARVGWESDHGVDASSVMAAPVEVPAELLDEGEVE